MADFGNKILPEKVFEAPKVVRFKCEPHELFTILLTGELKYFLSVSPRC